MLLKEFAEQRGQKPDTVAAYIREHSEEFEGHTSMIGKQKNLDEVAVEILDKKYPLLKPTQVIEDTEARRKLIEAQDTIILLQKENKALALASIKVQYLEEHTQKQQLELISAKAEIKEKENSLQDAAKEIEILEKEKADQAARADAAEAELAAFKSLPWYKKIFAK